MKRLALLLLPLLCAGAVHAQRCRTLYYSGASQDYRVSPGTASATSSTVCGYDCPYAGETIGVQAIIGSGCSDPSTLLEAQTYTPYPLTSPGVEVEGESQETALVSGRIINQGLGEEDCYGGSWNMIYPNPPDPSCV